MWVEKNFEVHIPPIGWFFLGWLGVVVLSAMFSDCGFFKGISDVLFYTLSFILVVNVIQSEARVWALIWAILLGIGLGNFLGFFSYFYIGTTVDRLSIGSLGFTAAYLSMIFSLLMGLWLNCHFTLQQYVCLGFVALVSGISLGFTHTRSMWVALLVIAIVGAILYKKWVQMIVVGALVIVFGGVGLSDSTIQERIQSLSNPLADQSFVDRYPIWEASMRMFQDSPVLGVGPKCFKPNSQKYRVPKNHGQGHNIVFHVAAEMGSIGLLGLCAWLGGYGYFLIRMKSLVGSALGQGLWFTALGCFLTILIAGLVDSVLGSEVSLLFMIVSGLLVVSQNTNRMILRNQT